MKLYLICTILIYAFLYLRQIYSYLKKRYNINFLLEKFNIAFKESDGLRNIQKAKDILVPEMPRIKELFPYYYSDKLNRYSESWDFIEDVKDIHSDLLTLNDYVHHDRFKCLNPITPIKDFFFLPSVVLKFFHIKLNDFWSKLISLITYLLVYFKDEIKVFIISIIQQFIQK